MISLRIPFLAPATQASRVKRNLSHTHKMSYCYLLRRFKDVDDHPCRQFYMGVPSSPLPPRIDSRLGPIFFLRPLQNGAHSRLSFFKQLIIVCGSSTIQYCVVIWHCEVSASNCSVEHVIWCYPEHKESV